MQTFQTSIIFCLYHQTSNFKGRRSTTTTAELLTKTPSNNPLLPQPRAMSVTDTCKVTDEEEDENLHLKETPDFYRNKL